MGLNSPQQFSSIENHNQSGFLLFEEAATVSLISPLTTGGTAGFRKTLRKDGNEHRIKPHWRNCVDRSVLMRAAIWQKSFGTWAISIFRVGQRRNCRPWVFGLSMRYLLPSPCLKKRVKNLYTIKELLDAMMSILSLDSFSMGTLVQRIRVNQFPRVGHGCHDFFLDVLLAHNL
jgi:hypothetical protein